MIDSSKNELVYSMEIIDKQLKNASQFSDWIFVNRNLDSLLTKNYFHRNLIVYDSELQNFRDFIDLQLLSNSSVGEYVLELIICGKNGFDLRAGNDAAVVEHQEAVGHADQRVHGVLDDDHGNVFAADITNDREQILDLAAAEAGQGLVHQEEHGTGRQGPRELHQT